jgi:uncharacterized damage-inducible protein DinB
MPGVHPLTGHLLRSAEHIREDVTEALAPLTTEQVWARPHGMTSAGFHAKHLAGSTQRLCTYLEGGGLSAGQLEEIPLEMAGTESADELVQKVNAALARYEALVRELQSQEFGSIREIGRKRLETTAVGLAIHIAEHGQRHTGQLISAAKLSRATIMEMAATRSGSYG